MLESELKAEVSNNKTIQIRNYSSFRIENFALHLQNVTWETLLSVQVNTAEENVELFFTQLLTQKINLKKKL
jgi:hypothetical protein